MVESNIMLTTIDNLTTGALQMEALWSVLKDPIIQNNFIMKMMLPDQSF